MEVFRKGKNMSSNKNENSEKVLLNNDENEFLCDNPISIDEIERGLWLGNDFKSFSLLFSLALFFLSSQLQCNDE